MTGTPNLEKGPIERDQGGTVNPPHNRKGEDGNPLPTARETEAASVSTKLERIAQLARQMPGVALRTLAHHIDLSWMFAAYLYTRKDAATGVDGTTAAEYAKDLQGNLQRLLDRAKSGTYRAPAVRRVYIPKGTGPETRPIGIPTFEDKVLQRAVAMGLEAVYEQDFLDCSYGFRPGRSAHQAIDILWHQVMRMGGCWLIEVDIKSFFDTLVHDHLRTILRHRVHDGVLLRLIDKWIQAGVLEAGSLSYPTAGTPQGGVISPLLANVYLHEVLDVWFERMVKPGRQGRCFLIRYADDFVMGFENEQDAQSVMRVLPKRFGKYGLTLHPTKTRLIDFRRPRDPKRGDPPTATTRPRTFDLLGFTHYWARSHKGGWVVKRKTARKRFARTLRAINAWCRTHCHWPIKLQHQYLTWKLRGHYAYYGITGNWLSLQRLRQAVRRIWCRWLQRRSQKDPTRWERFARIEKRYPLLQPRIVHTV